MKKIISTISMCLFALAMISCGGSTKQATPSGVTQGTYPTPEGMELATNECIELAEASPVVRAWGNAKHYDLSEAIAYAEADARAKMSRAIAAKVTSAQKRSGFDISKYAGTSTEGGLVTDGGEQRNSLVTSIAQNMIENTVVIKSKRYMLPNRTYNVYVTVEFQGGVSAMSKAVMDNVKSKISDEDKLKIQYELKKFEDEVNAELNKK